MYANQEVTQLRKAGKLDEAYRVGMQALAESPDDKWLRGAISWVYYEYIKQAVVELERVKKSNASPDKALLERVCEQLRGYARLKLALPDMAFSQIAGQLAKEGRLLDCYVPYLQWAGLDAYSAEDHEPYQTEKGAAPCVLTRTAREAMAWGVNHPDDLTSHAEFVLKLVDKALANPQETPQNRIWLRYDRAFLYQRLGKPEAAMVDMRETLKSKSREFWAWQGMARLQADNAQEQAIACLCHGFTLNSDPKYTVKGQLLLAELFYKQGERAAAIAECLAVAQVYQQQGWKFPEKLESAMQADWFDAAAALPNLAVLHQQWAPGAQALLYDQVKASRATYLRAIKKEHKGKANWLIVVVQEASVGQMPMQTLLQFPHAEEPGFREGDPLSLSIGMLNDRSQLLSASIRTDGIRWDCLVSKLGLIKSINDNASRGGIYLDTERTAVLINDGPEVDVTLQLGDVVSVWLCANPSKEGRLEAYGAHKSGEIGDIDGVGYRYGALKVHAHGFGFVDSDVFVPPPLVKQASDDETVSLLCVYEKKPNSTEYGWTALKLVPEVPAEDSNDSH